MTDSPHKWGKKPTTSTSTDDQSYKNDSSVFRIVYLGGGLNIRHNQRKSSCIDFRLAGPVFSLCSCNANI